MALAVLSLYLAWHLPAEHKGTEGREQPLRPPRGTRGCRRRTGRAPAAPDPRSAVPPLRGQRGRGEAAAAGLEPEAIPAGGAGAVPAGSAGAQGTRLPPTAAAAARGAAPGARKDCEGGALPARPPAAERGAEGCDAHGGGGGGGGAPPAPAGRRPRAGRRLPGRGVTGAAPAERCAG